MTALMSLPEGTPRTLLSDAVRLGRLLWERAEVTGDVDIVEDTSELLALAADAATDLARVEEARRVMAGQKAEGAPAPATNAGAMEAVEASRQRLHDLLFDAVRAMGGANRRLPEVGGQGPALAQLARRDRNQSFGPGRRRRGGGAAAGVARRTLPSPAGTGRQGGVDSSPCLTSTGRPVPSRVLSCSGRARCGGHVHLLPSRRPPYTVLPLFNSRSES